MKITFIRHSKTAVKPEVPIPLWGLSEIGISKANELSEQDTIRQLDVIYSSLQTKAIETMLLLAKPNLIPMKTHEGLAEVSSFTNGFEANEDIYMKQVEQYYSHEIDRIDGGETINEALTRFMNALESIVTNESVTANIGIVTHGYILSFFTGKYSDVLPLTLHHSIQQPDIAEFDWESKSFTRLWGE